MKTIIHKFTETGEEREVQDGEYYLDEPECKNWCSYDKSIRKYPILTYERIEEDWKPKEGDEFYYIDVVGNLRGANYRENAHYPYFAYGNYFATVELAEEKLKQIKDILKGVTQ